MIRWRAILANGSLRHLGGSVFVFNAALIHAGTTNQSNSPRRSVHAQFVPATSRTEYDWSALPTSIQQQLQPQTRKLLGLSTA